MVDRGRGRQGVDLDRLRRRCRDCSVQELCLPSALRPDDLETLAGFVGHAAFARGEHVFNAGDPFHDLYVVRVGAIKTWVTTLDGSMQVLGFHLPGELIGLDGVAEHHHRCTAESLVPSEVCRLPFGRLEQLADGIPALRRQLLKIMSREFIREHEHILMMGSRPAIERLSLFIQTLSQRRRLLGQDDRHLLLPMSRVDLGNYLALATETVSRLFARLQRMGIVDLRRHRLDILDMDRLIEVSGEDLGLIHYPD
jgi:CRP/FNR family transcriptional regulator